MQSRIKARKAPGFSKPAIFHKVMQILEAHHFRLPACRFMLDLFDKRVLEQIVLEEEDDEQEEEEEEEESSSASEDKSDTDQMAANGASKPVLTGVRGNTKARIRQRALRSVMYRDVNV